MPDYFKLTYATMFNPPEILHTHFEEALVKVKAGLGKEHGMLIDGKDHLSNEKFEDRSPVNTDWVLGIFQKGSEQEAQLALDAATKAFPAWNRMKWQDRVSLLRKAADCIDARTFEIAAVMSLEVGKNRMEALGDVAEAADHIRYACAEMERNRGYNIEMARDPLVGYSSTNISVLRPYGAWLVISPFNFPAALTIGPVGAALVTGNTVVMKPSTDTPWVVRLLAECFCEAGLPDGVVNYVTGPGRTFGQALIGCAQVSGVTFTGSLEVGTRIFQDFSSCNYLRPIILEMGGKNPAVVSRNANVERAAVGIIRSAFGLQGQKCTTCSRVYIEEPLYDQVVGRIAQLTKMLTVGDPTAYGVFMGPVINQNAYREFQEFSAELAQAGTILAGGNVLTDGALAKGYYCEPTVVAGVPKDHRLWKYEMFLPITLVASVKNLDEALQLANNTEYGLTAGFYGTEDEAQHFFDQIDAGVIYVNRSQGATTGAWPGFQPFGGWKGSGNSGKNVGGQYYLPLYMREQVRSIVK